MILDVQPTNQPTNQPTHGSLFSGRGGFDEGAEAAGFTNIFNSEIDPWCNRYLKNRFPKATQYADITHIIQVPHTTVLTAGFPCQDISIAKADKADGIFGIQSSLFFEAIRIVDQARPNYVFFENSPQLLRRGMHQVVTALAKIGYMCEWQCLRASDFGYPHKRERIYIIAYPVSLRSRHLVFRPVEISDLHAKWTSTEAYIRVCDSWPVPQRSFGILPKNDVVPGFSKEIHSLGNAVMPVIAEHLFKCVLKHIENELQ